MITFQQFLWLIHYGLIALYGFEIVAFVYGRLKYPEIYKRTAKIPGSWDDIFENKGGSAAITVGFFHCILYGIASSAVPLVLIIYIGVSVYAMWRNEVAKPFVKAVRGVAGAKAAGPPDWVIPAVCAIAAMILAALIAYATTGRVIAQLLGVIGFAAYSIAKWFLKRRAAENNEAAAGQEPPDPEPSDSGFDYDSSRFRSEHTGNSTGADRGGEGYNAEADYENALTEAQKWANQAASRENAQNWATKFERLGSNPALHPKDKLRYRLAAMLLRERLKGQGSGPGPGGGPEPSNDDLSRLGLPVPP